MAQDIFYIKLESSKKEVLHQFTRSNTGTLDYAGTVESADLATMQSVEGSRYFTPSWYTYLPTEMIAEITVYLPGDIQKLDANQYSFLLHIGAILLAVQERDPLLVAELLNRRSSVFGSFLPILLHIIKPIAAEALFAWVYGSFRGEGKFPEIYKKNVEISIGETDTTAILFAAARDALTPNPETESAKEMFIRYFKQNKPFNLTIGLVGASSHPWVESLSKLHSTTDFSFGMNFTEKSLLAGQKIQQIYASLKSKAQAEPYNPHDSNAISVSIDSLESFYRGIPGKSKAGYIRATGAEILRKARPNLFSYKTTLWRMGATPSYFENSIIMRLEF